MLQRATARRGATVVEMAVVTPAVFLLILFLIVAGMAVFRYQQVSHLAREGTRYASTHGGQYTLDGHATMTGVPAISNSDTLRTYLLTKTTALDPNLLTVNVAWSAPTAIVPNNIPSYLDTDLALVPPGQKTHQNYVTVTVTYQWIPEFWLVGPINLTSTSKLPMSY